MAAGLIITKFIQLGGNVPTILLGAQKSDGSQINKHLPEAILDKIPGFNTKVLNLADRANVKIGDVTGHEKGARDKIVLNVKQGNSLALTAGTGNDIKINIEEGKTKIPSRVKLQLAEGSTLTGPKGQLNPGSHYPNGMRGFSDETLVTMTQSNGKLEFALTDVDQIEMAAIDNDNSSWSELGATA